jgi:hypothetical protein
VDKGDLHFEERLIAKTKGVSLPGKEKNKG